MNEKLTMYDIVFLHTTDLSTIGEEKGSPFTDEAQFEVNIVITYGVFIPFIYYIHCK